MSDLPQQTADFIGKVSLPRWYYHKLMLKKDKLAMWWRCQYIGLLFLLSQIKHSYKRK